MEGLDWPSLMTDGPEGHLLVVQAYHLDRQGTDVDPDVGHPELPIGKGPCRIAVPEILPLWPGKRQRKRMDPYRRE